MTGEDRLIGGVEAGGTKFVCAIGYGDGRIERSISFPTRDPESTLAEAVGFFREATSGRAPVASLGIASFGPLRLDPASPDHGRLGNTPKPGWSGIHLRARLSEALGCPAAVDTDVNGAGLAEARLGAGQGLDCFAYLTVGTGIGGGLIVEGRPVHGLMHPEMGHLLVRRHPQDRTFPGSCPFHTDCVEGLASGAAILQRQGHSLALNPAGDLLLDIVADYIAQLCINLVLLASPQRIVIGGGVMTDDRLLPMIRAKVAIGLNGYVAGLESEAGVGALIVPPALAKQAGIIGALLIGGTA